ncbi:MAG: tyrosine--tRNA ligase [Alphaproteobacteria bacterium]|nr:tyrosine--tRNA ligase [Alphaproteobacteria bacterium]
MSDFLHEAKARGFVHQCTDEEGLAKALKETQVVGYCGFDATSTSLQVGNLVAIMYLRLLQKHGHTPIALIGGATTKIGDPSGKDESRPTMTNERLQENIIGIRPTFERFLDFNLGKAILVNNDDWLAPLHYLPFLQDIGRHFSINRMLSFDSVKLRLEREQTLSFLEFNYMIFQAYDFLELHKRYGCVLQLGGSDQWGNIVNGVELVRKILGKTVYGLTAPLITTSSGAKMGKTAQGAVWLNQDRLSPYDYWQYWRNTHDLDVVRYMKLFTDMPLSEIARFESVQGSELNEVKKILADEALKLAHGPQHLADIHDTVKSLFETGSSMTASLASLPEFILEDIPAQGISVFDLFVIAKLAASKGEARRLMAGGGLRVNDAPADAEIFYTKDQFPIKLSAGKKRHARVIVNT